MRTSPPTPGPSNALWLGASGLSVCGGFLVQYYSIKAFPMTDQQLMEIVQEENGYMSSAVISAALAAPALFALFACTMFIFAVYSYVMHAPAIFGNAAHKAYAFAPMSFGVFTIVIALIIGETIGSRMSRQVSTHAYHHPVCKLNTFELSSVPQCASTMQLIIADGAIRPPGGKSQHPGKAHRPRTVIASVLVSIPSLTILTMIRSPLLPVPTLYGAPCSVYTSEER